MFITRSANIWVDDSCWSIGYFCIQVDQYGIVLSLITQKYQFIVNLLQSIQPWICNRALIKVARWWAHVIPGLVFPSRCFHPGTNYDSKKLGYVIDFWSDSRSMPASRPSLFDLMDVNWGFLPITLSLIGLPDLCELHSGWWGWVHLRLFCLL